MGATMNRPRYSCQGLERTTDTSQIVRTSKASPTIVDIARATTNSNGASWLTMRACRMRSIERRALVSRCERISNDH